MLEVVKLDDSHLPLLENFCVKARDAGYLNNTSPQKMKFHGHSDLPVLPHFWGVLKDGVLASVSGYHMWPDIEKKYTTMRCLFRSATLPEYDNVIPGLSKNHMNSMPFSIMMPLQIRHGIENGAKDFLITTSHGEHDASGKMKRTHRALELLSKRGIVKFHREHVVYHVPQTLWRINLESYLDALRTFHSTRKNLGFTGLDNVYEDIIKNGF